MVCPACGLALPAYARFCARCGSPLAAAPRRAELAPVWVQALLWVGAGALLWVAATYGALAAGLVPAGAVSAADLAAARGPSALVAAAALSLCLAHLAAAIGLLTGRAWARPFTTMVCVVWALTCVGLPVGLLAVNAMWRRPRRTAASPPHAANVGPPGGR